MYNWLAYLYDGSAHGGELAEEEGHPELLQEVGVAVPGGHQVLA